MSESCTGAGAVCGFSSAVLGGTGVGATGPSEADLLTEEEDCIDCERCLFRLADPVSNSLVYSEGDVAGEGNRFMTFGRSAREPSTRHAQCNCHSHARHAHYHHDQ